MSTVVASNVFGHPKTDHEHFNSDKKTVLLARRFEESIAMRWVFKIPDYVIILTGGWLYEFRPSKRTFL
jgi:hypothetical protein